jgi:hypothetical protein
VCLIAAAKNVSVAPPPKLLGQRNPRQLRVLPRLQGTVAGPTVHAFLCNVALPSRGLAPLSLRGASWDRM